MEECILALIGDTDLHQDREEGVGMEDWVTMSSNNSSQEDRLFRMQLATQEKPVLVWRRRRSSPNPSLLKHSKRILHLWQLELEKAKSLLLL